MQCLGTSCPPHHTPSDKNKKRPRWLQVRLFHRLRGYPRQPLGNLQGKPYCSTSTGGQCHKKFIDKKSGGWIWDFLASKSRPSLPENTFLHQVSSKDIPQNHRYANFNNNQQQSAKQSLIISTNISEISLEICKKISNIQQQHVNCNKHQ